MKSFFLVVLFSVTINSAFAACNGLDCSGVDEDLSQFDNVRIFDHAKDNLSDLQHCTETGMFAKGLGQHHPAYKKIKNTIANMKASQRQNKVLVNESSNACYIAFLPPLS